MQPASKIRVKRFAIRGYFSALQGLDSRNGSEGMAVVGTHTHKRQLTLRNFFVLEKYVEVVEQGQKVAPDSVESIVRPTDAVKEEFRMMLFKMSQCRPKIIKIKV